MTYYDYQYEEALLKIKEHGSKKTDRTGTGTASLFALQMRWDLAKGFPLITTKRVFTRPMVEELLWMLSGSTNNDVLREKNVKIWNEWARADGELGPIYGKQWRSWDEFDVNYGWVKSIDQIAEVVANIKSNPDSRRHVVSAWNVADLPEMALAPCHCLFQFYVSDMTLLERQQAWSKTPRHLRSTPSSHKFGGSEEQEHDEYDDRGIPRRKLSLQLYQRSADMFLGVPFNIASYALLTHMIAQQCDLAVGEFIWTGGDCHIYDNHTEQVNLQVSREGFDYPTLKLKKAQDIFSYTLDDVVFENYQFQPGIPAPVAV